jgi:hypothetical protein
MNQVDNIMTDILIGVYIGITALIMVNIFIALLTSTFNVVHDSSKAFFLLQRAIEVIHIENKLGRRARYNHLKKLEKSYIDNNYNPKNILKLDDTEKSDPIKDSIKEIQDEILSLNSNLDNLQKDIVISLIKSLVNRFSFTN